MPMSDSFSRAVERIVELRASRADRGGAALIPIGYWVDRAALWKCIKSAISWRWHRS